MVLYYIGMGGYRLKHNLGYQQFADIINRLSFHNLNFDKNFVKYCCKKLKEIYVGLLKTEKITDVLLLATFWNQFFFRQFEENMSWMIGKHVAWGHSKPKQRANFKTWQFDEKSLEESFCCKSVYYERGKKR